MNDQWSYKKYMYDKARNFSHVFEVLPNLAYFFLQVMVGSINVDYSLLKKNRIELLLFISWLYSFHLDFCTSLMRLS